LAERGRVEISGDYRDWVAKAGGAFPLREAALNNEVVLTSLELELPTKDPADRFLAATALVFELELVTLDRELLGAEWLPTRSP
jgi:PIN domain nuclease of toxin-antitoxin system